MELALLQLYNSQRQTVLSKARQTIDAMRQHSEENGNSEMTQIRNENVAKIHLL